MIAVDLLVAACLALAVAALCLGTAGSATARRVLPASLVAAFIALAVAAVVGGQGTLVLVGWPVMLGTVVRSRRATLEHPVRGPALGGALLLLGLGITYAERLGPEPSVAGARPSLLVAEAIALALLAFGIQQRYRAPRLAPVTWILAGLALYGAGLVMGRATGTYRTSIAVPALGEIVVAEPARALVVVGVSLAIAQRLPVWRRLGPHPARIRVALPVAAAVVGSLGIAHVSGDLGGAMVTGLCVIALAAALIARAWPALLGAVGLMAAGAASWVTSARARGRIDAWLDPDRLERGTQQLAGVFALADGGWVGAGFGRGQALWSVPQVTSDYALAGIGHELGMPGLAAAVAGVSAIVVSAGRVASSARSARDAATALAVAVLLGCQALVNLMGITLTAPLTGVPYPFVSSGGVFTITAAVSVRYLLTRPVPLTPATPGTRALAEPIHGGTS